MAAYVSIDNGLFCTVQFFKADGTIRTINGRSDVRKYLKGNSKPATNETREKYVLIYTRCGSTKFDAPRYIARDRIISIRAGGLSLQQNVGSEYAKLIRV